MKDYNLVALFLTDSYPLLLEQKKFLNEQMFGNWHNDDRPKAEKLKDAEDLKYTEWKVDIIERVLKERLGDMERPIFRLIYGKRMTFREVKEVYERNTGNRLLNPRIVKAKKRIIECLTMEIQFCDTYDDEREYMDALFVEAEAWAAEPKNKRKVSSTYGKRSEEGAS